MDLRSKSTVCRKVIFKFSNLHFSPLHIIVFPLLLQSLALKLDQIMRKRIPLSSLFICETPVKKILLWISKEVKSLDLKSKRNCQALCKFVVQDKNILHHFHITGCRSLMKIDFVLKYDFPATTWLCVMLLSTKRIAKNS